MAKALFHKSQRVYVKPVGTFAHVEAVIPHWVKGVDEPLRVTYDVGLGREFTSNELVSEANLRDSETGEEDLARETWRVLRVKARWQSGHTGHHPYPGTFPVVVTEEQDWGGWRVPGAEYDRAPQRIEYQSRIIANAPRMLRILSTVVQVVADNVDNVPDDVLEQVKLASLVLRSVYEIGPDTKPELLENTG
ncbi:MAG: hypothetical protein AAFR41_02910 [Pseudomonadota bacterium]